METTLHRSALRTAWLVSLPVVMGYLPIGFAYGLLANKAGLSPFNTVCMSLMVYAGSAQLIAVGLFASGVPATSIILTTFVVNLRHLLMSAALAPHLRAWRSNQLFAFAYELTDETFAIHSTRFPQGQTTPSEAIGINLICQAAWVSGTLLGVLAGQLVSDVRPFGLDYALIAMFIALLMYQLKDRRTLLVALLAGGLSTTLLLSGMDRWNVILATIIAATLGLGLDTWIKTPSSSH